MSHFCVAVLSEPNGKTVEELLMPYHEFESAGIEFHIQNISVLDQARKRHGEFLITRRKSESLRSLVVGVCQQVKRS